jgi:hypothetical protein
MTRPSVLLAHTYQQIFSNTIGGAACVCMFDMQLFTNLILIITLAAYWSMWMALGHKPTLSALKTTSWVVSRLMCFSSAAKNFPVARKFCCAHRLIQLQFNIGNYADTMFCQGPLPLQQACRLPPKLKDSAREVAFTSNVSAFLADVTPEL